MSRSHLRHIGHVACIAAMLASAASAVGADPVFFNMRQDDYGALPSTSLRNLEASSDGTVGLVYENNSSSGGWATVYDLSGHGLPLRRGSVNFQSQGAGNGAPTGVSIDLPYGAITAGVDANTKLVVLSIADLDSPTILKSDLCYATTGELSGVAINGTRVCAVSIEHSGIAVDIPFDSIAQDAAAMPNRPCTGVAFDGDRMIVAGGYVQVIDIPPTVTGASLQGELLPTGAVLGDRTAVLIMGDVVAAGVGNDVWLIDVSNPAAPVGLGRVGAAAKPKSITLMTPDLLVVTNANSLEVIDISTPSAMKVRGAWLNADDLIIRGGAIPFPDGHIIVFTDKGVRRLQYTGPLDVRTTPTSGVMLR